MNLYIYTYIYSCKKTDTPDELQHKRNSLIVVVQIIDLPK